MHSNLEIEEKEDSIPFHLCKRHKVAGERVVDCTVLDNQ